MNAARRRPAVSVVIPAYNARRWLAETLASVRTQTFSDHEVVLVDDASTDGTAAWVRRDFPEVRVMRLARNQGPAMARNRGIDRARGELIALLDHDDVWREDYLNALTPQFRDPRVVMASSSYERIDSRGQVTRRPSPRRGLFGLDTMPPTSGSIMRRAAVTAVGGFDPGFRVLFDEGDLFARLALRHGPAAFRRVERALFLHRTHDVQLTSIFRPTIAAWMRRPPSSAERDRDARCDLAYLAFKHRRWLAPMLRSRSLYPAQKQIESYGIFDLACRYALSKNASNVDH